MALALPRLLNPARERPERTATRAAQERSKSSLKEQSIRTAFQNRPKVEAAKEEKAVKAIQEDRGQTAGAPEYVFDNAGRSAEAQHRELSRLYDENTIRHIEQLGIDRGWSCLEVGGGGGSIASWLCARVGVLGRVLATDLDPRFLRELSYENLEARQHDIRTEDLPKGEFDLAHARLVLIHLPDREVALRRMIDALKPDGWIVVEEFDALTFLPDPAVNPGEVNLRIRHAFREALTARGVNLHCGRLLAHELKTNGLEQVGVEATVSLWGGKSGGTTLMKLHFKEMREPMVSSGLITPEEFEADLKRIDEQDFLMPSPMMWSAWGRKPAAATTLPHITMFGFGRMNDARSAPVSGSQRTDRNPTRRATRMAKYNR